jgi:uncharacterized membrane protein YwzB
MVELIGIDKNILHKCRFKEQYLYGIVSFVALTNVVLSFAGFFYFFHITFNSFYVALLVGVFWSLIFLNLQRFVMQTISGRRMRFSVFISVILKMAVIGFFALLTAFPLQLMLMKPFLEKEVMVMMTEKKKEMLDELDLIFGAEELNLKKQIKRLQSDITHKASIIKSQKEKLDSVDDKLLQREISTTIATLQIEYQKIRKTNNSFIGGLTKRLEQFELHKESEIKYFDEIISSSGMIIERSKLLIEKKPYFFRLILGIIILLFWFPMLFKQITASRFEYDRYKNTLEKEYIAKCFAEFKIQYKEAIQQSAGKNLEYPELKQPK